MSSVNLLTDHDNTPINRDCTDQTNALTCRLFFGAKTLGMMPNWYKDNYLQLLSMV
jgi:hypothetical protein